MVSLGSLHPERCFRYFGIITGLLSYFPPLCQERNCIMWWCLEEICCASFRTIPCISCNSGSHEIWTAKNWDANYYYYFFLQDACYCHFSYGTFVIFLWYTCHFPIGSSCHFFINGSTLEITTPTDFVRGQVVYRRRPVYHWTSAGRTSDY